jgi:hypothetical protein
LAQGTVAQWFVGLDTHGVPANQVVLADGSAYEYAPSAGAWQQTDSGGVQALYAGVDSQGRPATLVLCTNGAVDARNGYVDQQLGRRDQCPVRDKIVNLSLWRICSCCTPRPPRGVPPRAMTSNRCSKYWRTA